MLSRITRRSLAYITNIKGKQDYTTQASNTNSYILNFSANWCGPCKAMAPILSKKETDSQGKWKLFKVDIDDEKNAQLNEQFQVQAVPTFIFFKNGKEVGRTVGGMNDKKLDEEINKII